MRRRTGGVQGTAMPEPGGGHDEFDIAGKMRIITGRIMERTGNCPMKYWIALAGLLFSASAAAQYDTIHYRDNDPFVFCHYGMKIPDPCWVPMPPYTGAWMYTGICDPPNEYGREWTKDDTQALQELERICAMTSSSGSWQGSGTGENSPYSH